VDPLGTMRATMDAWTSALNVGLCSTDGGGLG
jgi:hypothetical protein